MSVSIIRADARSLPLADESVDLIVTSPPYFNLRSYRDGGEHYAGQIGDEASPGEYVDSLIAATREMVRVLKPTGSLWLNLGDKYNSAASGQNGTMSTTLSGRHDRMGGRGAEFNGAPRKSLLGIPWRYALRCIDELGLILRAEVIWDKPNGLPESVTDRVRRSHETWFHFTRLPRYFSAVDEIRDEASGYHRTRNADRGLRDSTTKVRQMKDTCNPLGKLPGSVWEIPTQPLTVPAELGIDHFAAFPMEWPRRIIQGWSPSGICTACGEGRRPVHDGSEKTLHRPSGAARVGVGGFDAEGGHGRRDRVGNVRTVHRIVGEACACPEPTAPTRPAVVLDPFGGTGTTALVAHALGRHGIAVDMSRDYCQLAQWRTTDPGERAKAMQVEKPPAVMDGQLELFDETA